RGAELPLPVIYEAQFYGKHGRRRVMKGRPENGRAPHLMRVLAEQGFIVVVQDARGRFQSEGEQTGLHDNVAADAYDTAHWLSKQDWSNGNIGLLGCSHTAEYAIMASKTPSPYVKAVVADSGGNSVWGGGFYSFAHEDNGGAFPINIFPWYREDAAMVYPKLDPTLSDDELRLAWEAFSNVPEIPPLDAAAKEALLRSLPVIDFAKITDGPKNPWALYVEKFADVTDPWWDQWDFIDDGDGAPYPGLFISSWNDYEPSKTLWVRQEMEENATTEVAKENQVAVIHSGGHCRSSTLTRTRKNGERLIGDSRWDYYSTIVDWYRKWLVDPEQEGTAISPVNYHTIGTDDWTAASEWPPSQARAVDFYLSMKDGKGVLSSASPEAKAIETYTYDPADPAPTVGHPSTGVAQDQSDLLNRDDVVAFVSPVLDEEMTISGPLVARLHISSSAPDTDFVVKLIDIEPDGRPLLIQEGLRRARYRNGRDRPQMMVRGDVYSLDVHMQDTSIRIPAGHRLAVAVTSSSFPRWSRNLNTGENNETTTEMVTAENSIHLSPQYPSKITLWLE
ncbi:MAG: CocE/NonD family hydrolase, partial [Pseudomonadota bacterium]